MTTELATPNMIATQVYAQRYDKLYLVCLRTDVVPDNAGPYYYLVYCHGMSHTAFRTAQGLRLWAVERGIELPDFPLVRTETLPYPLDGAYVSASHCCERSEFEKLRGYDTFKLDNARYTRAVITQNEQSERVVNYMNCNYDRIEFDYQETLARVDGDRVWPADDLSVHRDIMAAYVPDVDGWEMSVDMHSGAWLWERPTAPAVLYATPWYEGLSGVPLQLTIDGDDVPVRSSLIFVHDGIFDLMRTQSARDDAQRYVQKIALLLQWVDARVAEIVTAPDDRDVAIALSKLVEDSDDVEFPQVARVESFESAGVLTKDAGFVLTLRVGTRHKSYAITVQEQ